jgi:hypothetical protein
MNLGSEPAPLDPAIQNALTNKLTAEIVTRINVKGLTDQAATDLARKGLPRISTLLRGVSGSLASGVASFVHSSIHKIITGPQMANAWVQVNRVASQALVAVLSGQAASSGAVGVRNGKITLDLAPLEAVAKQDLVARGLTIAGKIPIVHATFALFPSKNLVKAQKAYRLINDLKIVLPILTLVLLGLGVLIARRLRRALIGAGLGFAASMLVLAAGLLIARALYLNSVPAGTLPPDAAAAAFDIVVRFIKTVLRTLLVAGLVVAAGAFFTGPPSGDTNPPRAVVRPGPAAPRRAIRAGQPVDLRAPRSPTDRGSGAGRAGLRLLGPADRRGRGGDRRPAAGLPRPHRGDRQGTRPAKPSATRCGPVNSAHKGTAASRRARSARALRAQSPVNVCAARCRGRVVLVSCGCRCRLRVTAPKITLAASPRMTRSTIICPVTSSRAASVLAVMSPKPTVANTVTVKYSPLVRVMGWLKLLAEMVAMTT